MRPVVLEFMRQLQDRIPRLKRGTGAVEVQFFTLPELPGFEVRLRFKDNAHYNKVYTERELLGATYTRPPTEQRIQVRPCECVTALGGEVLDHLMRRRT